MEYCAGTRKRRRYRKRIKTIFALAAIVLLIILVAGFFDKNINPVIYSISEANTRAATTLTVTNTVAEIMSGEVSYSDIVEIIKDAQDKIKMIRIDAVKINLLTRRIAKTAQENLAVIGETGVLIPVGSLTGIPIFAGRGIDIKIKILPIASVTCNCITEFFSAGINQTLHRIVAEINSEVYVVLPGSDRKIMSANAVLVFESIIIGDVPAVYLNMSGLPATALNLLPQRADQA
ncbi:MAG: sporulation protein YunB [Clostridiales bacterium]|nr:sporulation protein YunB [Clostridiales bacterium]